MTGHVEANLCMRVRARFVTPNTAVPGIHEAISSRTLILHDLAKKDKPREAACLPMYLVYNRCDVGDVMKLLRTKIWNWCDIGLLKAILITENINGR
jgi:hypothetical protein